MANAFEKAGKSTARTGNWLNRLTGRDKPVIPVVRLQGTISSEQRPGRLNIASVEPLLKRAFAVKRAPAIAIIINSPGGSPVQSRLISKMIRDMADEHDKQVLVFVEDVAASGGYFIAVAGDVIIADPSSIVGSIGVIYAGFGFEEAIAKLGIKRRIHTAGRNKSSLDPFVPEKPEDVERLKGFELDIHQVFIDHVKARRAERLKGDDDDLFTGEWWTAMRGLDLGLIDELGDMHSVLRARFGKKLVLRPIAPKRGLLQLPRLPFASQLNAGTIASETIAALEDRALWSRFGL
ncbi:S49 family peptidase [Mariluticola halotolerans]|uniref:S49 family peptidase n=1 Tax=Mariluticola halotolerans TaxID=2909283 RepID=UPI0026E3889A|nr:S49 family peptidase [Mariluticola halotolerans]UJQ95818.1 S49 family peptidase [Mariluticola halotolerans]